MGNGRRHSSPDLVPLETTPTMPAGAPIQAYTISLRVTLEDLADDSNSLYSNIM